MRSRLVQPLNVVHADGKDWVQVEWASDGRYDIGYQRTMPVTERFGATYMGCFELWSHRMKSVPPSTGGKNGN